MSSLTRQRTQLPEAIDARAQLSIRHLVATSRYRVDSPSLACVAAITWLFNVYRPRLSVNLSVGDGVAFFAACQAVDRLQSSDLVHGHIQRDEAGRDRVVAFNADNYGHFASLFDYADSVGKARYRNDSIDLIYVEVDDFEQFDVTALVDKWTPKTCSGGCIVIQHGCPTGVGGGVDGVPLPPDLVEGALAIHCGENAGLIVLPMGDDQPAPIARLREAGFSTDLDFVFSRLGLLHRNEVLARTYKDTLDRRDGDVTRIDADLKASEARRLEAAEDIEALRGAYADRSGLIARLQAQEMDRSRDAARQAEQTQRLATAEAALEAAHRALAEQSTSQIEALEQRDRQLRLLQDERATWAEKLIDTKADPGRQAVEADRDRLSLALAEKDAQAAERQARHDEEIATARAKVDRLTQDLADVRDTASRDLAASGRHIETLEADQARHRQAAADNELKQAADLDQRDGQIGALDAKLAASEAREEALRDALIERDADIETLSAQRDESRALALAEQEAARAFRLQIARLEGETDVRFRETATLTLRCEQLDRERALALAEAQDAQIEIRSLADALDDRDRRLIDSETALQAALSDRAAADAVWQGQADRLAELETRLVETETRIQALEQDKRRLAAQVQTMRGTTSWKATAPIRNAGKAIKNLTRSER